MMKVLVIIAYLAFVHGQEKLLRDLAADLGINTMLDYAKKAGAVPPTPNMQPFTIFAPTDKAFAALPESVKSNFDSNTTFLRAVFGYHTVPGNGMLNDLSNGLEKDSIHPITPPHKKLRFNVCIGPDGKPVFTVSDSRIIKPDNVAINGVPHVIEKVLMIPEGTVVDHVVNDPRLSILKNAVVKTGLVHLLSGKGPFTVFAPTNAAFEKMGHAKLDALMGDKDELDALLKHHVGQNHKVSACLNNLDLFLPLEGYPLTIKVEGQDFKVNDALVLVADIVKTNGVIHIIDTVIMKPPPPAESSAPPAVFTSMMTVQFCIFVIMLT